jgi:hypothetical protein
MQSLAGDEVAHYGFSFARPLRLLEGPDAVLRARHTALGRLPAQTSAGVFLLSGASTGEPATSGAKSVEKSDEQYQGSREEVMGATVGDRVEVQPKSVQAQGRSGRSRRFCRSPRPAIKCPGTTASRASSRQPTVLCASYHVANDDQAAAEPLHHRKRTNPRTGHPIVAAAPDVTRRQMFVRPNHDARRAPAFCCPLSPLLLDGSRRTHPAHPDELAWAQ